MTSVLTEQASIDLKIILRKEKMDIKRQLTLRIGKGVSAWEQWVSTATSKAKVYHLRAYSRVRLTIERLATSKRGLCRQVNSLLRQGAKHLIWLVVDSAMLICWLSLLTLLVPLYVMAQVLALSLQGLMYILTKL